ncbi:MAG: LysM peptidoglycan-binding domain-containing protein [Ignavibacteria bacterium]|nr:LysM peptidoglycan-binding domain-containing protein [Ignavibacteria bacterium]
MQNKFFFNTVKCFFYIAGCVILLISFSQTFTGCSGSEDEVEFTQRDKDSIATYISLQKSFSLYRKALAYNEASDNEHAKESFESSLRYLNEINYELISKSENYFWKQDFNELTKSIVEDYLITQPEISQNSLVFVYAQKVPVAYERVEERTMDREPLPKGSDVPFVMNSAVEQYIEFFSNTDRGRMFVDKCLYRSGKYFPLMRKILKLNNAPEELVYLSVQESGLNPTIVSRAGAVGLWQFMPATGRSDGLYSDGYLDDRRDFEKATDAAANLLKDLYKTFDDWYLAFCAYNAGPGRVNSAIRKSGSKDFWSLRGYLPGETKNYVPSIIALSYVLQNPEEYGFKEVEYGTPLAFDRVNIKANITLQKVAELSETDIETIRDLNPELTSDIIPEYDEAYQLRIPHKSYDKFAANYKRATDIDNSNSPEFAGNEVSGYSGSVAFVGYKVKNYEPEDLKTIGSASGKKKVSHEFKKKEQLSSIAVYYNVRPTDIRIWNNISYGSQLKAKEKLSIYLTEDNYKKLYGKKNSEGEIELTTDNSGTVQHPITVKEATIPKEETTSRPVIKEIEVKESSEDIVTDNSEQVKVKETETITGNSEQIKVKESVNETVTTNSEQVTVTESVTETETESPDVSSTSSETEYYEEEDEAAPQQTQTYEPETKTVSNKKNTNSGTYIVSEGDNLSMIAGKYGVSVNDLKKWNDLESDKIMVGQKLKMTGSTATDKKTNTKTSGVKKTYKVKKGETLASISEATDVSIQNLMKWNNLKSDKIMVGQIIRLYDDGAKQKVRKKKN